MNGFDAFGRPLPTAEERAEFEAALEAAKAKFRAAALAEPDFIGAGWRPWMGTRKEPTAAEVAAFEANAAAVRARLRAEAIARGVTLTDVQRWAAEARPGEPVHLTDPDTARRFVLLPAEVYDRLVKATG